MPENKMSLQELKQNMTKPEPDRLYFFYGSDEHTKSYFEKVLKNRICGDDTLGYVRYGDSLDLDDLDDSISSYPMFGGNKFILVKNCKLFKNPGTSSFRQEQIDRFVSIIDDIPDYVVLCFSETDTDKTNPYFKELIARSSSYDAQVQTPEILEKFVINIAKKNSCQFRSDAASLLVEGIGSDTLALSNETEKLCLAAGEGGTIDRSLVLECCTLSLQANIFDLTDSLCKQDKTNAMKVIGSLINSGESIQKILIMTGSHFAKLFYVKELAAQGKNTNQISDIMGNKPYYISKLLKQCQEVSEERLRFNVDFCFKADCDIKSGEMSEKDALDLLILAT